MTHKPSAEERQENDKSLAKNALAAFRSLRKVFTGGLTSFLEPDKFDSFADWWVDRQKHGSVPSSKRAGYVLRAADMYGLAPSLFEPKYYHLSADDLPAPDHRDVHAFLSHLIARSSGRAFSGDVATAIEIATSRLGGGSTPAIALANQAEALCDVAAIDVNLYRSAVSGDLATGRALVYAAENAPIRGELVRVFARQRIIWNAADVQRIAARGSEAAKHYVAWFLRPFIQAGTANEVFHILRNLGGTDERLASAENRAARAGKKSVSVPGPEGPVLRAIKPAARPLELTLGADHKQSIIDTRQSVHHRTMEMKSRVEHELMRPDRSDQETIHQYKNAGLSEIAALFVVAYRFAEDEAKMAKIIANPTDDAALWQTRPVPYPTEIDPAIAARARRIVAAYRPAILRDSRASTYEKDRIDLAEDSERDAKEFLVRIGRQANAIAATDASSDDVIIAGICDLSHHSRSRLGASLGT